ncbi:MAG: DNA-binding response regulator [Chloroflexi bacterium RBG_13_60_9]|nr:MAG: DNA-binding response regulator [Chloroflexi bacterium RBG_13_60_9]
MTARILIVDDEPQLVRVIRSYLEKAGYQAAAAYRGDEALQAFRANRPDLVILDLNLPGMDGLDVAREIRRLGQTPIIMLTARVEETDRLVGLELGADDYVTKPFSPREVVARVRAVLRRVQGGATPPEVIRTAGLEIDVVRHTVRRGDQLLDLTPTEFSLLAALAGQPGRVFNRMQLLELAQGSAFEGYERTIDVHIKNLRAKIEPDPKIPTRILTVFGIGYKFAEE